MELVGYFVFAAGLTLCGPLFTIILMPVLLPISAAISVIFKPTSSEEIRRNAGLFGGVAGGAVFFLVALLVHAVFKSNSNWLTGIGIVTILVFAPKVINAKYAVPAQIIVFLLLSLFLLPR